MPRIRIDDIAGVPILYDRDPASNYGITGTPVRPWIDDGFAPEVERMFSELFLLLQTSGLGTVTAILFGGIGRTGQGASYHYRNRAFDLDGLIFSGGETWVARTFPQRPHLYLAIEAVVRQHFGTVLTYGYNSDHEDHIHFDNGDSVGFRRHSKSRVLFLQNALHYLFDESLLIDGVYGPETRRIETIMRAALNLGPLSETRNWRSFLGTAGDIALDRSLARSVVAA